MQPGLPCCWPASASLSGLQLLAPWLPHSTTHCPLPQVLFGMAGGILAGVILGCTRIWNNKYKRLAGIYGAGEWACARNACQGVYSMRLVNSMLGQLGLLLQPAK